MRATMAGFLIRWARPDGGGAYDTLGGEMFGRAHPDETCRSTTRYDGIGVGERGAVIGTPCSCLKTTTTGCPSRCALDADPWWQCVVDTVDPP